VPQVELHWWWTSQCYIFSSLWAGVRINNILAPDLISIYTNPILLILLFRLTPWLPSPHNYGEYLLDIFRGLFPVISVTLTVAPQIYTAKFSTKYLLYVVLGYTCSLICFWPVFSLIASPDYYLWTSILQFSSPKPIYSSPPQTHRRFFPRHFLVSEKLEVIFSWDFVPSRSGHLEWNCNIMVSGFQNFGALP
jgi:hypothetical protein